jgi:CO/xanthine dehydrogenase Mo-binding subunit
VLDPIPSVITPPQAAQTLRASYFRPFHMHASLGPSAAVAQMKDGKLTVWTHAQGVYPVRAVLAPALGLSEADVHILHMEGPGCYGQTGADDAAFDAAILAQAHPGRPISLKWMRTDEHRFEPYGPAMAMELQASLDPDGEIMAWNHTVWSYPHLGRPRAGGGSTSGLLASWYLETPFERPVPQPAMWKHVGAHRNADPLYILPRKRVVEHFVADSPFRTSSMRGLGAYGNVFAIESFMDELAHAAGVDPVGFRLRYLHDPRAREVLEAAVEKAGRHPLGPGHGRGVAFAQYKNRACYCAVVMDVSVNEETGDIRLIRAVIAADAGQIVNPDALSNQLEGGLIQSSSWTLHEQVQFDRAGVTSLDWETYPILRFSQAPVVETVLLNRPGAPFLGGGEASQGPTGAAIANAVFDASGIRLRTLPFTPARVRLERVDDSLPG